MSTSRSLFQALGVLKGAQKVAVESIKIVTGAEPDLYAVARAKSAQVRGTVEVDQADEDIFELAKNKSERVRKSRRKGKAQTRQFSTMAILYQEKKPDSDSQSPVPSSKLQRLFHYGSLAAQVGMDVVTQGAKNYAEGKNSTLESLLMSPRNIERMARKLRKMRGAALKIGQMLSLQDNSILPKEVQEILMKVQDGAQYMPANQLENTISFELGDGWRQRYFASFDDVPIAAASIGQVHKAVTKDLKDVVMKVQYPGVADSIDSDLDTILMLLTASQMLPKGLFLEKSVANARVELKWECDYIREAKNIERFADFLKDDEAYTVPKVYHEISDEHVMTMERMTGTEVARGDWDQQTKNWICENIMRLCLNEIYTFRFMQTDPNWANFLYNKNTKKIELLDFGACRSFPDAFIKSYANCLRAAVKQDRPRAEKYSLELGYLTGLESEEMKDAHIDSMFVLGEPFCAQNHGDCYDFSHQTVTDRVRSNIGLMLNERLTPPPEETYSLHRKLSGAYLLCARMNAVIPCEKLFEDIIGLEYEE